MRARVLRQPGSGRASSGARRRLRAAHPAELALFNPALPRSAPQLFVFGHVSRCLDGPKSIHAGPANKRLLESIDRQALLAWLQ